VKCAQDTRYKDTFETTPSGAAKKVINHRHGACARFA